MIKIIKESLLLLSRRKSRVIPAVLATAVGIFLMILISSIGSYFTELSMGISKIFSNRIFLCEKKNFWIGGGLIPEEKVEIISKIDGISEFVPMLITRMSSDDIVVVGIPDIVVGISKEKVNIYTDSSGIFTGKNISADLDALVGWDIAQRDNLNIGSEFTLKGKKFKVSGIMKKTSSFPDRQVIVNLKTLQDITERQNLITCVMVVPEKKDSFEKISSEAKKKIEYIKSVDSSEIEKETSGSLAFWNYLTLVFFLISGVGSLASISSVISMAVTERKSEIAVKRALGAEKKHIFSEFFSESFLMVVFAWIIGVLLSYLFVFLCQYLPQTGGGSVFRISIDILILSFVWSVVVSAFAVWIPLKSILSENTSVLLRG